MNDRDRNPRFLPIRKDAPPAKPAPPARPAPPQGAPKRKPVRDVYARGDRLSRRVLALLERADRGDLHAEPELVAVFLHLTAALFSGERQHFARRSARELAQWYDECAIAEALDLQGYEVDDDDEETGGAA